MFDRRAWWGFGAGLVAIALACACGGDDSQPVMPDAGIFRFDGAVPDAGEPLDAGDQPRPDGSVVCTTDLECDDSVECTLDRCDVDRHYCLNEVDNDRCQDGTFCNGRERCTPGIGCQRALLQESCNDEEVCTIDTCDEAHDTCLHAPRDLDRDGDPDEHCMDGHDCDDLDPRVSSLAPEICGDAVDNNCNGQLDDEETGGCAAAPHDTCDDPLDVSEGGFFMISTVGTARDYTLGCGFSTMHDVVMRLTLTEPHDVRLRLQSDTPANIALQRMCGSQASTFECLAAFDGTVRSRSLVAGTYYVVVQTSDPAEVGVEVTLTPPTAAPANASCAGAIDVSAGGTFTGSLVDVASSTDTSCGSFGGGDVYYRFTTSSTRDVSLSALSATGDTVSVALRGVCADATSETRCASSSPSTMTLHSLPAGTYYLVLEGSSFTEIDYTLQVAFRSPTAAPAGDVCATAITLPLGAPTIGTLVDKEDDLETMCGFHYKDAVYRVVVPTRSDLEITVASGAGGYFFVETRVDCMTGPVLRCVSGGPSRTLLRGLDPGTYFVVVESFTPREFEITATATPPVALMAVMGNDTCETAVVVPPAGGVYTGTTAGLANDYMFACGASAGSPDAAFRVVLTGTKRIVANTDGSTYDTVLGLRREPCANPASEAGCSDDGGFAMADHIDVTQGPGTYYVIVDGFGSGMSGMYVVDIQVRDP